MYSAAGPGVSGEMVAAFFLGAFALGFIWMCVAVVAAGIEPKHEKFLNGVWYDTRRANRIFGVQGERVTTDGQWIGWMQSLWRTHSTHFNCRQYCFVIKIDDLRAAKIVPVTDEKARAWLRDHADHALAEQLIRDWLSGHPANAR